MLIYYYTEQKFCSFLDYVSFDLLFYLNCKMDDLTIKYIQRSLSQNTAIK